MVEEIKTGPLPLHNVLLIKVSSIAVILDYIFEEDKLCHFYDVVLLLIVVNSKIELAN